MLKNTRSVGSGRRMENTSSHPIMVESPALPFVNPFLEIALKPRTRRVQIPLADKSRGDRRQLNKHGCVIRSVAITFSAPFSASAVSSPEVATEPTATSLHCEHFEKCSHCSQHLREQVTKAIIQAHRDADILNMLSNS